MGIDWYWIKQRPQIVAEMLLQNYDVTAVYYREVFVKQSLRSDKDELKKSYPIPAIPYRDKNKLAFWLQRLFFRKIVKKIWEYDIVWITNPLLYQYIPENFQGQIIYDCMDNYMALCNDKRIQSRIQNIEFKLVHRADIIFASSEGLIRKIMSLNKNARPELVRNGFIFDKIHSPVSNKILKNEYKIGYFGTISEWFDFSALIDSLDVSPKLEYHLWGPISNIEWPHHPRIFEEGIIEHSQLWNSVKTMDCLVMPFKLTEAVKDVDPVKMYEYIDMGKPIISIYYKELDHFKPFVHFYTNTEELKEILSRLIENNFQPGYNEKQQREFLEKNSWKNRYKKIKEKLEERSAR